MTAGERIKQARNNLGISQQAVASAACVSVMTISNLERGKTRNPASENLHPIAKALHVLPDWIMTGARDPYDIRFGENLRRIRKEKALSKIGVADILSEPALKHPISLSRYTALETGEGKATPEDMIYIAAAFEIENWQDLQLDPFSDSEKKHAVAVMSVEDAIDKLIELDKNKTLINIYENIEASAGDGSVVGYEFPTDHLWVENKWLQEIVHFVPKEMAIIKVKGDSMEPTLSPGDMILIDRQQIDRNQLNDGVYVISRNETTHVKRLQCVENGIRIISDNKALYDSETVSDDLTICGRVIWAWRGKRF